MLYGILDLSFWGYVVALLLLTHFTIMGVTLYLHRCQAHRGLTLHPIVSHFFRFWLWLTTGMVTKQWVAIHRKHHARCETEDDPHSPQILGIKKVLWEGAELYRKESKVEQTMADFGTGTPDDWIERHLYTPHSGKGIFLMMLIDLLLFGIPGISIWALQMAWIPFFAAGIINGVGHYMGYRNFECPDQSRNLVPLAFFLGGEELHNNHHTYGTSAKFSVKWWEFDLGWAYIRTLQTFGLAQPKRLAPKTIPVKSHKVIDGASLQTLLSNRFQIMANYTKHVLSPVLREEREKSCAKGRALLSRAKQLLGRERSLVGDEEKQRIAQILQDNTSLDKVYQFKEKLQDIWEWTTASQKELVEAVQDWCRQAESSGIDALKEFANYLQGYVVSGNKLATPPAN